jgi:hypothetical protein
MEAMSARCYRGPGGTSRRRLLRVGIEESASASLPEASLVRVSTSATGNTESMDFWSMLDCPLAEFKHGRPLDDERATVRTPAAIDDGHHTRRLAA